MENNRKVFFFIDSMTEGGAERVVALLSEVLVVNGYDVSIVMLRKDKIVYDISPKVHLICAEDCKVTALYSKFIRWIYPMYHKLRSRFVVPALRKVIDRNKIPKWNETKFYFYSQFGVLYREILSQNKGCTALGFLIRSNIALGMALTCKNSHNAIFCERNAPIRPDIPPKIIKLRDKYCKKFKKAVFQTEDEMQYYSHIIGQKVVIPNPVKTNLPLTNEKNRNTEIVNFCRLSSQKNIPLLVDAFAMLHQEHPEYALRIIGDGDEKGKIEEYINNKGLSESAKIEPFDANIHKSICNSAMFVSTSDFEGLSNSMLEAMAMGLPCVCTDCDGGGARMMIQDHENGLLVPKGDVFAVYNAMKEIIENPDLAKKLSQNAVKVREELSVDKIVNKWIEVIGD